MKTTKSKTWKVAKCLITGPEIQELPVRLLQRASWLKIRSCRRRATFGITGNGCRSCSTTSPALRQDTEVRARPRGISVEERRVNWELFTPWLYNLATAMLLPIWHSMSPTPPRLSVPPWFRLLAARLPRWSPFLRPRTKRPWSPRASVYRCRTYPTPFLRTVLSVHIWQLRTVSALLLSVRHTSGLSVGQAFCSH